MASDRTACTINGDHDYGTDSRMEDPTNTTTGDKQRRDQLFKSKVLKRLYGSDSDDSTEDKIQSAEGVETNCQSTVLVPGAPVAKRVYGVTPPPSGVQLDAGLTFLPAESNTSDESSSTSDTQQVQTGRKRRKKRHRKKRVSAAALDSVEHRFETDKDINNRALRTNDSKMSISSTTLTLSKNQKRKLKKKRKKERKKV